MTLRNIILSFAFLVLNVITPVIAVASPERFQFEPIPGSYNHLISALHRDHNGMIWVGTATGLNRYDGYNISRAKTEFPDSTVFLEEHIKKICEDTQGRLWIKAEGQIYGVYDPSTHKILADFDKVLTDAGIPTGLVNDIQADKDGSIWIVMAGDGIYKIPQGSGKAIKADIPIPKGYNFSSITFNKFGSPVCVDESGTLTWIDPHTLKTKEQSTPIFDPSSGNKEFYEVTVDNNNRYWIYAPKNLELFDGKAGKWISDWIPDREKNVDVKYIYPDDNGDLWILRDNHGLEKVETSEGQISFRAVDHPGDITYKNTLTNIFKDEAGTTFLGSYKKGLFTDNDCIHKFSLEEFPDVNCMTAGTDNWVWIGTDKSGLWRWNTATGEKYPLPDLTEGENPSAITSLVTTSDNTLYVGAFSHGLRRVRGGKFEKIVTGTSLDTSFPWSLDSDGKDGIWIASLGNGAFHYNPSTGEIKEFTTSNSGIRSDYLTSVEYSGDGRVYFGHGGGIDYYDPADGKIHDINQLSKNFDTSDWKITQIFEDSRGLLWVATSQGLKIIDRVHKKMTDVVTYEGKINNYITGIIEDDGESIWISEGRILTNLNVNYVDATGDIEISAKHYDTGDGLMDSEFNQRSFVKLPSGEIMLGGLYGANRFNPIEIGYNSIAPKVIFTDLFISNQFVHAGKKVGGKVVMEKALHDGGVIKLSHKIKDFTIKFTTDNYALPEKTTYRYKLEGYDDNWHTLSSGSHSVTYTNLSPGNYCLIVYAINGDGFESLDPAKLYIKVYPAIWRTIWAYIIYAILLVLAVWGIMSLITRFERKRLERLKEEELNQLKYNFFKKMGNDFRNPLTKLISPIDGIIQGADNPQQRKRLRHLKDNMNELLYSVNQMLDSNDDKQAEFPFDPQEGDIVSVCKTTFDSFVSLAERKRVNYTFRSNQPEITMAFDKDKLQKIVYNLIESAFKFTPPYGSIKVSVDKTGDVFSAVRIKVADTGNGIDDKDKEFIFDSFYHLNDNSKSDLEIETGLALSQVSKYVGMHRGTVKVTDNVETGSVFTVELPIDHVDSVVEPPQSNESSID